MLLIGLTGGIASGKSLVSERFAAHGAPLVDADLLAREVVRPGSPGLGALVARFGTAILAADGGLDRAALRERIFSDPSERAFVDATLHPLVRGLSERRLAAARETGRPYAVYAVPLLVETGQVDRFDRIVVVDVPLETQLERLLARDGRDERQARAILAAQAPREARLAVADDVVDNAGPPEATLARVDALHARYVALAAAAAATAEDGGEDGAE